MKNINERNNFAFEFRPVTELPMHLWKKVSDGRPS